MPTSTSQIRASRSRDDDLRNPFIENDRRALFGSQIIAWALGLAFLLVVYLGSSPAIGDPALDGMSSVDSTRAGEFTILDDREDATVAEGREPAAAGRGPGVVARLDVATAVGAALVAGLGTATGGMVGDPIGILRTLAVSGGGGGTPRGFGEKVALGQGADKLGAPTPSRGGISGGAAGGSGSIGSVGRAEGVERSVVRVAPPTAIRVGDAPAASRDVGAVGTFVRARAEQLAFCYDEHGLKVSSTLAGSVTIAIVVAGNGIVADANVSRRTWSGPGSAEVEACILRTVRAWRLPASDRGAGTYSLPVSFTR